MDQPPDRHGPPDSLNVNHFYTQNGPSNHQHIHRHGRQQLANSSNFDDEMRPLYDNPGNVRNFNPRIRANEQPRKNNDQRNNNRYFPSRKMNNGDNKPKYVPPRFARSQNVPQSLSNITGSDSRSEVHTCTNHDETHFPEQLAHSFHNQLGISFRGKPLQRSNYRNVDTDNRPPTQNRRNNFQASNHHHAPNGHRQHRNHPNLGQFRNDDSTDVPCNDTKESQREIMDELLRKGHYECAVCCDFIKISQKTFNCSNCFNVFHLNCIQTWARKSNATESASENATETTTNGGSNNSVQNASNGNRRQKRQANSDWRCPTCQWVHKKFPYAYFCFCGKVREPAMSNYHVPHSCAETCSRSLNAFNTKSDSDMLDMFPCDHKCTLMCHPGKCAPCSAKIERTCACKSTKIITNCISKISELKCDQTCNKPLSCGKHLCQRQCHYGECGPCQVTLDLVCFCGKETKTETVCSSEMELFACEQTCAKLLSCGFHTCTSLCHPGDCGSCPFDPDNAKHCPCDQTLIISLLNGKNRLLCLDPIPVCEKICNRRLPCGSDAEPHYCKISCHNGPCPPCALTSIMRCECGANSQKLDCKDITSERFKCKKLCKKKLCCGRHKCLNSCCTDKEHGCSQVCGRKLSCFLHNCTELCHSFCKSCPNVIWTELYCNCGEQILYPPLPCGTPKPVCDKPCALVHPCSHPPTHQCHDDPQCPPCTVFVSVKCFGNHEVIDTVPCFQSPVGVSCGRFCQKLLPCQMHNCVKVCHNGPCPPCTQRCKRPRQGCEHGCGLACHQSSSINCPESHCKEIIKIFCKCKKKSENSRCCTVNDPKKFQLAVDSMLTRYNFNTTVSLSEIKQMVRYNFLHQLDCDEKCAKEKRNKDLAEALGIENPSELPTVKYSDFLKNEARSNPQLILSIHDKLVMLMQNYRKNNTKTMNYSFPAMNRNNREIIHNYAAAFGLKSSSVDAEPNRSVIVTAVKTSTIPEISLLETVNVDTNLLRPKQSVVKVKTSSEENKDKKSHIDYFNFDGDD